MLAAGLSLVAGTAVATEGDEALIATPEERVISENLIETGMIDADFDALLGRLSGLEEKLMELERFDESDQTEDALPEQ